MTSSTTPPLLDVRGLRKHYRVARRGLIRGTFGQRQTGIVRAVDDVSFTLKAGQTLGLVGESGCGKTTTARSILDLVRADAGEIRLDGRMSARLAGADRGHAAGAGAWYVFRSGLSLNPRRTINEALREPFRGTRRSISDRQLHATLLRPSG
jgi:ABC-type glutathione transport system ATPase component